MALWRISWTGWHGCLDSVELSGPWSIRNTNLLGLNPSDFKRSYGFESRPGHSSVRPVAAAAAAAMRGVCVAGSHCFRTIGLCNHFPVQWISLAALSARRLVL